MNATMSRACFFLIVGSLAARLPAHATAGIAEWEVTTPGGNRVSHTDPWKADHATFVQAAPPSNDVLVSHVEWWSYYDGYVAGQSGKRFFLLHERSHVVTYFSTEQQLMTEIADRRLGKALGARMTPADGWNAMWGPFMRERCKAMRDDAKLDAKTKAAVEAMCRSYP